MALKTMAQWRTEHALEKLQDEMVELLMLEASAFDRCEVCHMEAYAVKRDPRYSGAGWCTGTNDGHHMWPVR